MNEYSLYNPESELAHHGILGMKWGVRRYQNPDGSLTPLGRKRFARSRKNPLLNYYDKDSAKNIYKRKASEAKGVSKALSRMSQKEQKKADKLKDVDSEKSSQHSTLAKRYASNSEAYEKVSEMYSQKVKDIKSGLIKAGEDFIVQADVDWYGIAIGTTLSVVEKPKNDITKQSSPNNSNSVQNEEKSPTPETSRKTYKSDMMETARKTGKYDIDFLESIQNSYVLEGSKKERLREYSKYLDNPRTYVAPPETRPSTNNKTRTDKLASRAKAMQGQYTQAEIAEKLGISPSYVSSLLS